MSHKPFLVSRSAMKYQLVSGFPPLCGRRAFLQESSSCLVFNTIRNCSNATKPSDYPERNLISILLMRVDSTSGQHSRCVSSLETLLGALLKLKKRKIFETSCGLNLIHRVAKNAIASGEHSLCRNIRQLIICSHVF